MSIVCPKCGSDDVLVGHENMDNTCADCDHKWEYEGEAPKDVKSESIITFKSPHVLMTINYGIGKRFKKQLDEVLSRL